MNATKAKNNVFTLEILNEPCMPKFFWGMHRIWPRLRVQKKEERLQRRVNRVSRNTIHRGMMGNWELLSQKKYHNQIVHYS